MRARTVLEAGHALLIPQPVARREFVGQLERLARDLGADFLEVALIATQVEMRAWFAARSAAPAAATDRDHG